MGVIKKNQLNFPSGTGARRKFGAGRKLHLRNSEIYTYYLMVSEFELGYFNECMILKGDNCTRALARVQLSPFKIMPELK